MNYLVDEAVDTGKGGNTVASLLHHFFEVHGLGERKAHLHADNCVGQNKNNYVMQVQRTYKYVRLTIQQVFVVVSFVEGDGRSTRRDYHFLSTGWAY